MAYAGAIANGELNEDTRSPDGAQYGIPGGKNADGPNNAVAQASAGLVLVVTAILTAGGLEKKIQDAVTAGQRLLIKDSSKLAEQAAEKLIEKFVAKYGPVKGRGYLAATLHQNGAIGPYSILRKFTDDLGGKYQAHHILEVQYAKHFGLGHPDKMPAVLLTDQEHKAISKLLASKTSQARDLKQLLEAYKEVYKKSPHWIEAIEAYFTGAK